MTGGQLNANADQYLQANGLNMPPPLITSDPLVTGTTPIEQLLRVLGLAANAGDPGDNSESIDRHAERDLKTAEAAAKFPAQDEEAAAEMAGVAGQGDTAQMAQQLPQMASGIAGALAGAIGGALQPLAQISPAGCPRRPAGHADRNGPDAADRRQRRPVRRRRSSGCPAGRIRLGHRRSGERLRGRRSWRRRRGRRRHHADCHTGSATGAFGLHVPILGSGHADTAAKHCNAGRDREPRHVRHADGASGRHARRRWYR